MSVHVCMYMYACICMCICMCVYMYVCMYVCMHMRVYAYMYMFVCIIYWGELFGGNVLPKTGGGIVQGELSGGIVHGGNVLHPLLAPHIRLRAPMSSICKSELLSQHMTPGKFNSKLCPALPNLPHTHINTRTMT